jgi:hypothetical protein
MLVLYTAKLDERLRKGLDEKYTVLTCLLQPIVGTIQVGPTVIVACKRPLNKQETPIFDPS